MRAEIDGDVPRKDEFRAREVTGAVVKYSRPQTEGAHAAHDHLGIGQSRHVQVQVVAASNEDPRMREVGRQEGQHGLEDGVAFGDEVLARRRLAVLVLSQHED